MGGCRCSYKNCQNTTKTTENIHFFHYPVKHKERCRIWIENANKTHFCDLEEDQLRNKVICENHFEDKWFPNSQKKRLLQGAVPTLDGDCTEEELLEPDMYISTGLQEIQILPASSDGSLFILDTDSIFNRSQKVESFVYKNGMILPSTSTVKPEIIKPKLPMSKPSTSKVNLFTQNVSSINTYKYELDDPLESKIIVKKEAPDYDTHSTKLFYKNGHEPRFDVISPSNDHSENSNSVKKSLSRSTNARNPGTIKQSTEKTNLARNYLKKIKQHSRDIACIKKMLRQKALSHAKPDTDTILGYVKEELPPTIFTVLNLNLNNKYDLTEEDEEFFTTIHKISPQLYQLLVEKYKWNLPCIDTPME